MRRTNQGGSVLGFTLVAVALALILVGALYIVRQQAQERVRVTPQSAPVSPTSPAKGNPPVTTPTPSKKAPSQQQSSSSASKPASSSASSGVVADTLPHTGPSETFIALLAVGLLSWSIVAYVRSRRIVLSF